jgi:pimeloyl-ACP methyl ester carboxylesterase
VDYTVSGGVPTTGRTDGAALADSISAPGPKYIDLSHGRTRYFDIGDGPPVLLLHGAGFVSGGHSWLGISPELASRYRVIAPDVVGWGPGDQLEQPYSFAYLVDFIREFQDALGLRATNVVGHSMGGWLAALLAYESPDRVDRLVLVAGGGLATRPLASMVRFTAPSRTQIETRIAALGLATQDTHWLVDELATLAQDEKRVERFGQMMRHMSNPETRARYNLARRLPLVRSETLVLWGTADTVNDVQLGVETAKLIPRCQLVTFEAAGHSLVTQRRAEVVAAIGSFIPDA